MNEVFTDFGDIFEHFNANSFFSDILQNDPFFQNAFGGHASSMFGGGNDPFSMFGGGGGMMNDSNDMFSSFSSFGGGGGGANVMSQSISSTYVNGKKITTKKTQKNGQVIIEKYENDQLVRKSINGQQQQLGAIGYKKKKRKKSDHY